MNSEKIQKDFKKRFLKKGGIFVSKIIGLLAGRTLYLLGVRDLVGPDLLGQGFLGQGLLGQDLLGQAVLGISLLGSSLLSSDFAQ